MKCTWCGDTRTRYRYSGWDECMTCGSLVNQHEPAEYTTDFYTHSERIPAWRLRWPLEALRGRLALRDLWPLRRPPLLHALARAGAQVGETLLDWGCGSGMYVDLANCYGLRAAGWDPHGPRHGDESVLDRDYDWVLLRHVLEHVPHPSLVMDTVRAERALVFLPCTGTPQSVREGLSWDGLNPWHICVPTIQAAVDMFGARGWRTLDVWNEQNRQFLDGSSVIFSLARCRGRGAA